MRDEIAVMREALSLRDQAVEAVRQELSLALQTISMMRHRMFGRSSEQIHPGQGKFELLLNECNAINGTAPAADPEKIRIEFERRRKAAEENLNGRMKIPDHLERVERIIDLPESEKICPATGLPMIKIGEEVSEKLAYEAGRVYVIRNIRPKYASPDRRSGTGVRTAPVPEEPINRCKADVSLLSHVIISKYCDHLPLHRQVQMFQRHGIELPKSTMCDWVRDSAEVFRPLYKHFRDTVLSSDYVNADDTPMDFMDRKRKDKGSIRGRMWAYLCRTEDVPEESANAPPGTKLMFFDFTENWSEDHPISMLKDFKGHLQTDAYAGFRKVTASPDVTGIGCWSHGRRKFYQAAKIGVREAEPFVTLVNILYRIEHRIADMKEKGFSDDYLLALRRKRANRVMDRFFEKVKSATLLPKSPLGKALTYAINQEHELRRYIDELRFRPDNNVVEQSLRVPVLGKKNFVLLGSECGGRTAAVLYTLICSCRANGINPQEYIADVLARINTHPYSRLAELLPHNWQRLRQQK